MFLPISSPLFYFLSESNHNIGRITFGEKSVKGSVIAPDPVLDRGKRFLNSPLTKRLNGRIIAVHRFRPSTGEIIKFYCLHYKNPSQKRKLKVLIRSNKRLCLCGITLITSIEDIEYRFHSK
ncbi:hypothetical protein CDAR_264481 [Caerostris darwini]|uniref:Uncharacterized protein n=1 Tax=Caerostris darwini TaxID=1538125 RepID=A0AAV4TJB3_9ARAC|nr:hypothetical protein CDAR_264481 [Caerostris darwini]